MGRLLESTETDLNLMRSPDKYTASVCSDGNDMMGKQNKQLAVPILNSLMQTSSTAASATMLL
jgi:hypothetical protein